MRSLIDACNAVAYAHSRGVVHRDLKPDNIMLGRFGETLVVDWGLAKAVAATEPQGTIGPDPAWQSPDDSPSLTRPGSALGTPQYMSPEQALGDLDRVGPASDVYSLGATLYCLLVGHGPFSTGGVADVIQRVRRGIFPAPRRLRRSIDPALEAACLKAMSVNPADRHATPTALAEEIEAWLADVRYRAEHDRALGDVKRSLARLAIEPPAACFERGMTAEGMLWLARALENVPPDSPELDRAVRAGLGGWHAGGKPLERTLTHRDAVIAVAFSPDGRRLATACRRSHGAALGRRHGLDARLTDDPCGRRPRLRLQPGRPAAGDDRGRRGAAALGRHDGGPRRRRRPSRGAGDRGALQPRRLADRRRGRRRHGRFPGCRDRRADRPDHPARCGPSARWR